MTIRVLSRLPSVLALVAILTASPALAQGKGKGNDGEKARSGEVRKGKGQQKRPELQRRDRDERDDERYDDRWDDSRNQEQDRGPAFCRTGEGHPKFGWRWCEERGYGRDGGRYEGRADSRYPTRYPSRDGRNGSYDEAHADFHRYLDRKYSDLADDRPLDPVYQIRIRRDRKAEHDRWHAEMGRRHD